jgi:hypothetical protein
MKSDFLNREKRKLAAALEDKIIGEHDRISYAGIKELDLPEAFFTSLHSQARTIFRAEKPIRIIQSDRFDFSDEALKTELSKLRDLLLEQVTFRPNEIRKAIHFSLTLHFDLIVQPFKTIESILFQSSTERDSKDCIEILNSIGENLHFIRELTDRLLTCDKEKIAKADLAEIAIRIKSRLYNENPVSSRLFDLESLQKFYTKVYDSAENTYSADIVSAMLRDRGMDDFAQGFEEEKKEKKVWAIAEIQQFLERHLLVGQLQYDTNLSSRVVYPETVEEKAEQEYVEENVSVDTQHQKIHEADTAPQEISLRKKNGVNDETISLGRSFRTNQEYDGTSTDIIKREQIEYQPPGPYPALNTIIDNRSRSVFIKKIFGKNKSEYVSFIDQLEKKESWKEAKAVLDAELASRNISPYCREAVKLSDLIFARYFSKGKF